MESGDYYLPTLLNLPVDVLRYMMDRWMDPLTLVQLHQCCRRLRALYRRSRMDVKELKRYIGQLEERDPPLEAHSWLDLAEQWLCWDQLQHIEQIPGQFSLVHRIVARNSALSEHLWRSVYTWKFGIAMRYVRMPLWIRPPRDRPRMQQVLQFACNCATLAFIQHIDRHWWPTDAHGHLPQDLMPARASATTTIASAAARYPHVARWWIEKVPGLAINLLGEQARWIQLPEETIQYVLDKYPRILQQKGVVDEWQQMLATAHAINEQNRIAWDTANRQLK
jgi:hypothetical protein